jgi:hypothetical protein
VLTRRPITLVGGSCPTVDVTIAGRVHALQPCVVEFEFEDQQGGAE